MLPIIQSAIGSWYWLSAVSLSSVPPYYVTTLLRSLFSFNGPAVNLHGTTEKAVKLQNHEVEYRRSTRGNKGQKTPEVS